MTIVFKHEHNKQDCFNIRAAVFMVEQGFSYDFDTLDFESEVIFVTAYDDADPERALGTSRIFPAALERQFQEDLDANESSWVIGRIAVLSEARHLGLGSKILVESERIAKSMGAKDMHLHAQVRAQEFYKRNGYVGYGAFGDDEGVPHQWMKKEL